MKKSFEDLSPDEKVILAEKLVDNRKKTLKLYQDLEEALKRERCAYHVVKLPDCNPERFMLFTIPNGVEVRFGTPDYILSYLNRRSIPDHEVYDLKLIKN